MLYFEVQTTGDEVGTKLAMDSEEAWYAIRGLADEASEDFAEDISDHASGRSADKVAAFLRKIADAIEARG